METRIRVIKRGEVTTTKSPSVNPVETTDRQRDREMATTVKSWIAEWRARDSALKAAAVLLARSLAETTQTHTVG